jgi:signal transduction histidine kinase
LVNFCQQIIQELQSIYSDRIINLINEIDLPYLCLDSKVLRYILTNLLSNALKYSPQDTTVDFKIALSPNQEKVIIEVRDRGMGIPLKSLEHLFESFYRASNVGDIPGTGLGLSIVKQSVELHRGTIAIDSEVDRGTNVIVTLPIVSSNGTLKKFEQ